MSPIHLQYDKSWLHWHTVWPSDAIWRHDTWLTLVQAIPWHLNQYGLSFLFPKGQISMKFQNKIEIFCVKKIYLKICKLKALSVRPRPFHSLSLDTWYSCPFVFICMCSPYPYLGAMHFTTQLSRISLVSYLSSVIWRATNNWRITYIDVTHSWQVSLRW